jgi:hypothetical protein
MDGTWRHLSVFSALSVLSVFSVLSVPLSAQAIHAEGLVLKPDSSPVGGARVILHQLGRGVQGPLDSTATDQRGRFRFAFRPDTSAIYLLSTRHAGIEYFSPPIHTNPERPDTALRIVAYDTSSSVRVRLEARHLVLTRPGDDGSRSALDLLVLRNEGQQTRVSPDSTGSSWAGPLPSGTLGLELGEGDVSPDALSRRNDSLIVSAPLAPGEKQITIQYLVPADKDVLELPFPEAVAMVNILTEEEGSGVTGGTMTRADSQAIQGRSFRRWTGAVPAGGLVRVTFPASRRTPQLLLLMMVGALILALGVAAWHFLSRRKPQPQPILPGDLIDAIARLDARYLGREAETPVPEWDGYLAERARLKTRLEASLAEPGSSR